MPFDALTVLMILLVGSIFIIVFLLLYTLSSKTRNPIITTYIVGKAVLVISYGLLAYRESIPENISIILGNILLFLGIAMEVFCITTVWEPFSKAKLFYFLLVSFIFGLIFSGFTKAEDNVRIAIATVQPFACFMYGSLLLVFTKKRTPLKIFMGFLYFLTSLSDLGRFIVAVFFETHLNIYSDHVMQLINYLLMFFMMHLGVVYLLISLKEQDEEKIREINKLISEDNAYLKELNEVKTRFFSIIAHDLRSPIGSLSELLGVLHEKDARIETKRRQKILDILYTNSKRLYKLLTNLLLWARSESGDIKFAPGELAIREVVSENLALVEGSAEIKNIRIDNQVEEAKVFADRDMLNFILRNLLSNALKFTREDGTIRLFSQHDQDGTLVIGVEDNGVGIAPEILPDLFNLDAQYVRRGTHKEKGSGLGLKLCYEFIVKHEGKIWAESKEDLGSTFYFTLPLMK